VYASAGDGRGVLESVDGGISWSSKTIGLADSSGDVRSVYSVVVDQDSANIVYAVQRASGTGIGGVYKSVDRGESWLRIDSALKLLDAKVSGRDILICTTQVRRIYVSLDYQGGGGIGGLFSTRDEGKTWVKLFEGRADPIARNPFNNSTLYLGTIFGIIKITDTTVTHVDQDWQEGREDFQLYQSYPNPFNSTTKVQFQIGMFTHVIIKIHDVLGRQVKVLIDEFKNPGFYEVSWEAQSDTGVKMPSGVYFYTMETAEFTKTKKLLLLK